jgi:hypothetical protein
MNTVGFHPYMARLGFPINANGFTSADVFLRRERLLTAARLFVQIDYFPDNRAIRLWDWKIN